MVLGDAVVVKEDGCEVLTATPRELFSVPGLTAQSCAAA